ncbi:MULTISPECIES: MmyB family transcriptional regulator [unclassified Nonomuraea]|uniref:MmyB family transcriptional regulator n=1 Tax=unclassified Nonomuraea TaxID=2593643 RepID=UPI00191BE851|nr:MULTISPECIES: hypothetical protein [unclassified Nonomuraea]
MQATTVPSGGSDGQTERTRLFPALPTLAELVGELTLRCPEFTTWWNDHRVLRRTHGTKCYHHPAVGELHFSYESFQSSGDPDQTLCVYNVEPGSATADAIRLLSGLAAPATPSAETR